MVRALEADEALGMFGRAEQRAGVLDPDDRIGGGMEEQQRAFQPPDLFEQVDILDPFEEIAAEREIAPADRDLALAFLADRLEIAIDPLEHMRHIAGCADSGDCGDLVKAQIIRRRQHRRTAEAMPDQQDRLRETHQQFFRCRNQIGDIGGEAGTAEFAIAPAQPGKVKAQTGDAFLRQRARHADRRAALLGASEAMREQRRSAHQPGGQFERTGQFVAGIGGDSDLFGRHDFFLASEAITPPCTSGARSLTLT